MLREANKDQDETNLQIPPSLMNRGLAAVRIKTHGRIKTQARKSIARARTSRFANGLLL